MPPSSLFVKNRATTAGVCTAYRYIGASPTQLGDTFGVRGSTASSNQTATRNGLIHFKGNIYARAADGVYVKDDPTTDAGTWTQAHAFTNPDVTTTRMPGLHVIPVNDVPTLVTVFKDNSAANGYRWAKFDGTTWTASVSATNAGGATDYFTLIDEIVYRGVLHFIIGGASSTSIAITFDPGSDTFSAPTEPFTNPVTSMCVFNDRLLAVYLPSTEDATLAEYTGGSWVAVAGSNVGWNSVNAVHLNAKFTLFTDGTYLYGMVPSPTTDGCRCVQWDASLGTPVNITDPVLPLSLRSSVDGGSYGGARLNTRWATILDQNTDPALADKYLYQSPTQSGPWTVYKWNGPGSVITQIDSGGDVTASIPSSPNQAGEYIFTPGEMDIWITGKTPVVGGQRVYFSCSGDPGNADKIVNFRFNDQGEPCLALATLIGMGVFSGSPAGAPTLGTNQVENVDADPSVVYYADWILTSDGFTSGDRAQLKPVISI